MKLRLILIASLLFPAVAAFAQEFGNNGPEIRQQLEQIKIWQMTKEMNLPTEKAEQF